MYEQQGQRLKIKIIETKYGMIYSREAGQYGQPLILIIHGSGPRNSSAQYQILLQEYLIRIAYFQRFYLLAIDCPGYGHSGGSKQAIKTFPRQLLQEILDKLNYKNYFALFGHSQGGAAIFNAVFQDPTLTEVMVHDRPVCGNIQRFRGFQVPTLLIYDIEDDGHPISQGKQLYKQLKNSQIYTYRTSKQPYWSTDNIWNLMIAFFDKWVRKGERSKSKQNRFRSTQTRQTSRQNFMKDNRQTKSLNKKEVKLIEKIEQIQQFEEEQLISKQKKKKLKKRQILKENIKFQEIQTEIIKQEEKSSPKTKVQLKQFKFTVHQNKFKQTLPEFNKKNKNQQIIEPQKKNKQIIPLSDNQCSLCYEQFFHPTKLNCNHIFCERCITEAILVNPRCPLCRRDVTKRFQIKELHQEIISKMDQETLKKRIFQYSKFTRMMQSIVFIQLGNTSTLLSTKKSPFTTTKKKFNWELFVIQPKNLKFQSVDFNINMGDVNCKPVKVKSAPWVYQSRGTFSFSCQITIYPRSNQYSKQVIIYRIDIAEGRHSKKIAIKKKQFTS